MDFPLTSSRPFGVVLLLVVLSVPARAQEEATTDEPRDPEQEELPLEVGRRLTYTATEGSWTSVDVSPDGRTMVFDHLGDLFTVPIDGGKARRLTRVWHRDGGSGAQLIEEPDNLRTVGAAFGPDERYIWFSGRSSQGSIYNNGLDLYHLAGRGGVGSHGQLLGLGYHWERWAMGAGPDVSPHEALRIATIVGASSIGFDDDLGSLQPGKLADLVILDANPLDDLRNSNTIDRGMKNGRLYDGDALDELWPRRCSAGPFYWQKDPVLPHTSAGIR